MLMTCDYVQNKIIFRIILSIHSKHREPQVVNNSTHFMQLQYFVSFSDWQFVGEEEGEAEGGGGGGGATEPSHLVP